MNGSLRKAAMVLATGLSLSQNGWATEPAFQWPEPGTVVTTKPDNEDEANNAKSRNLGPDSFSISALVQESVPEVIPQPQAVINGGESRGSVVQQPEPLPAPTEFYQLPPNAALGTAGNGSSINGDYGYLQPQAVQSSPYSYSPAEPEYEPAESVNQFTVTEPPSNPIDDAFLAGNIANWRPLFVPSQMVQSGLFVGGETTFLTVGRESYQSVAIDSLISSASIAGQNASGFGAGGRGWVGLRSGKTGFIATAWHFNDENANVPGTLFGENAVGLARIYDLQATTVDLELFQEFCFVRSTIRTTLGGRYTDLRRRGYTTGLGKMEKADVFAGSHGAAEMTGWGLTGSLAGYHPLRRPFKHYNDAEQCVSPWSFQWLIRGAVIDGEALVSARTEAQVSHSAGVARSADGAIADWEGVMSSGMLQLGIGYRRPLQCLPAFLDFTSGFEGHIQQAGKVGVTSTSNAFLQGNDGSSDFGASSTAISNVNARDIVLTGFFMRWSLNY